MAVSRLAYLFDRYINNKHTEADKRELMSLLARSENEEAVQALIAKVMAGTGPEMQMPDHRAAVVLQEILKTRRVGSSYAPARVGFLYRVRVAAAILLCAIGAVYWFMGRPPAKPVAIAAGHSSVQPKQDHAVLTMSDGKTIVLDNTQKETLEHGDVRINKNGTLLVFDNDALADSKTPVLYNTLSTPPGSQYQIVLPDGSKVWLNAGSSLQFPSRFVGSQRQVSLTGEAYFEVTKNKDKPFQVTAGKMSVNVLGTHFDVNAYGDNGMIKTSLLEGSVRIVKKGISNILKPGEQAVVSIMHEGIETAEANLEQVMAWKNGLFQFDGADVQTIMGEISRWYDVQIVYTGKIHRRSFAGKISRSATLSEVLQILEISDVKFSVKGRKIIVE